MRFPTLPIWPGLDTHERLEETRRRSEEASRKMRTRTVSMLRSCPACKYPMMQETRWDQHGPFQILRCTNWNCGHEEPMDENRRRK